MSYTALYQLTKRISKEKKTFHLFFINESLSLFQIGKNIIKTKHLHQEKKKEKNVFHKKKILTVYFMDFIQPPYKLI